MNIDALADDRMAGVIRHPAIIGRFLTRLTADRATIPRHTQLDGETIELRQ